MKLIRPGKHSRGRARQKARDESARAPHPFALYVVIGALALGVIPVPAGGLFFTAHAQKQRPAVVSRTEKPAPATAGPVRIDTKPLKEFLARAKRQNDQGRLDLRPAREITVEADRAADGTLSNAVITGASASSPVFRKLAQEFVVAINDSHALSFLQDVSRVRMTFALDETNFTLRTNSDTPSEARAEEMARGYRAMINVGRIVRRGTDDALVLNNMKVSSSGKQLVMNLQMTREEAGNLILRQITPN